MRMWIDYSSAKKNVLIKKQRMEYGWMLEYVQDTKLDT